MSTTGRGRFVPVAVLVTLLVAGAVGGTTIVPIATAVEEPVRTENTTSANSPEATPEPRIVELYPSPVAHGNAGEFVVVEFPSETTPKDLTLHDDGRQSASLPDVQLNGTVAFSHDPEKTEQHTDHPVYPLNGHIQFAEDGETVTVERNGTVIDRVTYDRAPQAELWTRGEGPNGAWSPIEATDLEPKPVNVEEATAFVLPDAPETPVERIEDANDRIKLAAYTYSDRRVTEALVDAHERGVDVQVAVEASPVGGTTEQSVAQLDELTAAGIDVVAFGGDHARYRFHHGKFAVVDDEAIVMTENWKPSGTGGQANRGWGVVAHGESSADAIAEVFEADLAANDSLPWEEYGDDIDPVEETRAEGSYPATFDPQRLAVEDATVLTAPDNAEAEIRSELEAAEESIDLTQVSIGGKDDPLLQEALDAARRGVELRILLSSAWYTDEDNEALVEWIDDTATEEDLDIEVRLAEPGGSYERLHTKGVIIDEKTVVVGSINWNTHSLRENRELAMVIEGNAVASYYASVFDTDWEGVVWRLPIGLGAVIAVASVGGAVTAKRTIEFEQA